MKNPWVTNKLWRGRFSSNKSTDWDLISSDILSYLQEKSFIDKNKQNGCFIISYSDFCTFFENLEFVHVRMDAYSNNGLIDSFFPQIEWECKQIYGEFIRGTNAGGSGKHNRQDFWLNPQFKLNLVSKRSKTSLVHIIVSIMQMGQIRRRIEFDNNFADSNAPISFSLFKVKQGLQMKTRRFRQNELIKIFNDSNYVGQREISRAFSLEQGFYILIPSLYEKDVNMDFFIRVFIS